MISIEIGGKLFSVKNALADYVLTDFVKISQIELPKVLKDLIYSDGDGRLKIIEEITPEQAVDITEYFRKIIPLISDLTPDLILQIDIKEINNFVFKYLFQIITFVETKHPHLSFEIKSFDKYFLPDSLNTDDAIPMYFESAVVLCEAIDLYNGGWQYFNKLIAVLCRPKEEVYDEVRCMDRAVEFNSLDGQKVANIVGWFENTLDYIDRRYKWVLSGNKKTTEKELNSLNKSGLSDFGFYTSLYEVVEAGLSISVDEVKRMKMYDFLHILSYIRSCNKYKLISQQ